MLTRVLVAMLLHGAVHCQPHLRGPVEARFLEQFASGNGLPNPEDPDEVKFINHDLMIVAARSTNGVGYVKYNVDLVDDYQYTLELGVEVEGNMVVLDDLPKGSLHSFDESRSEILVNADSSGAPKFKPGDHLIGSHEGRWNDLVTLDQVRGSGWREVTAKATYYLPT